MSKQLIYLDNNATTQVAPEVLRAMTPYFGEYYGNPSSLYEFGTQARRAIEEAREEVAGLLGAKSEREIIFTSGGTESIHTAIFSALEANPNKKRIVTTQVEHSAVRNLCFSLQKKGYEIVFVPVNKSGALDYKVFEESLTPNTALVSIMWANNETGVLFPVEKITETVKTKNILLHVDAVQAVGKLPVELKKLPVDYLSFSAHKFHGPKGTGGLYFQEGAPFSPVFNGGRQERDRRAGTENVPGIVGLSKALLLAHKEIIPQGLRIERLRNRLEEELIKQLPDSFVNGKAENRLANTTNITIPGVESEALLIRLSQNQIAASSGSACLTGAIEPSYVLQAMGHSRDLALSSVRLSLSRYTTDSEIDQTIQTITHLVNNLRKLNPAEKI